MRLLLIVPDADGRIRQAEVQDVQNEATWPQDGGLLLQDGRLHNYPTNTLLFDLSPATSDILAWAQAGKYGIVDGELAVDESWIPPGA